MIKLTETVSMSVATGDGFVDLYDDDSGKWVGVYCDTTLSFSIGPGETKDFDCPDLDSVIRIIRSFNIKSSCYSSEDKV